METFPKVVAKEQVSIIILSFSSSLTNLWATREGIEVFFGVFLFLISKFFSVGKIIWPKILLEIE